jgi:hypothetical protein
VVWVINTVTNTGIDESRKPTIQIRGKLACHGSIRFNYPTINAQFRPETYQPDSQ